MESMTVIMIHIRIIGTQRSMKIGVMRIPTVVQTVNNLSRFEIAMEAAYFEPLFDSNFLRRYDMAWEFFLDVNF